MVSAPRCRLLALLLLLPLPGARGHCGAPPRLRRAVPCDTSRTEGFPIGTEVTYRCLDGFVKIPGKSDTVVCLPNSEWSTFGEFCNGACGSPPRLKSATLSKEDGQKNYCPPGSTVTYDCRPGYESTKVEPVVTCLENLTWSEAPEFCRGKSCGVPKGPEHGRAVVLTNDLYGARANIICDDGFRLHRRTFIQCLRKGDQVEWSQLPTCQAITCSPPPNIANGMHNGSNVEIFVYNSLVTYKCDHNFLLIGEASIHCTTKDNINGVWNGSAPECKVTITTDKPTTVPPEGTEVAETSSAQCRPSRRRRRDTNGKADGEFCGHICDYPPRLSFAELPGVVNNSYPVGTELKYSCRRGYVLGSGKSPLVTCLANSTWSVDPEFCVGIPCKQLELENGRVHLTDHQVGATANFSCNEGYRLIGTTSAQCVVAENGVNWDKELPHCQAIPCPPPYGVTHGSHTGQSEKEFTFGSAITYKCVQGFSLIGEASIHCTTKDNVNGEWSGPPPECKAIPCHPPPDIANGSHTGQSEQEFSFGSAVTYKCDKGYSLIGEASIHCTTKDNVNGEWSGPAPECKGRSCKPLELENGRVHLTDLRLGTTATFSCDEGYRLIGTTSAQCVVVGNGVNWDKELPHCQAIPCPPPYGITNGSHTGQSEQEFFFGSAVTYKCDQGFSLIGEASIHCTTKDNVNGEWSGPAPECKGKSCGVPEGPEHGRAVVLTNDLCGARANIICDDGFRLRGGAFIQCLPKGDQVEWSQLPTCQEASIHCTTKDKISGVWNGSAPECKDQCVTPRRRRRDINGKIVPDSCSKSPDICGSPPTLSFAELPGAVNDSYPVGTELKYSCRPGYVLGSGKSPLVTCLANSTWSVDPEFCVGQCGALPRLSRAIPYDTSRTEGFPIGTEVTYRCLDGFVKIPGKLDTVVCLSNSEWSAIGEFCNGGCGTPPRLKSATLSKEDGQKNYCPPGSTVTYDCRPGYESTEVKPVITCLENLTWSEAPEFCRGKSCGVPKGPEHGRAVVLTNDLYGKRANIICDDGFRLHGRPFIQCLLKGDQVEWSQLPTCEAITCSPPPNITNGMHNGSNMEIFVYNSSITYKCQCGALPRLSRAIPYDTSRTEGFPIGTEVTYRCLDGFVKIPGKSDTVVCLSNSEWSTFGEFCNGACGAPPRLKSATLSKEDGQKNYCPPGSTVTYDCRPGYESTEVKPVVTCLENLTWSEAPEFCRGKSCGVPKGPEHGRAVVLTNDLCGARANIICDDGFRLRRRTFIQCLPKGDQVEWSQLPTCQAITCSPPPNIANGMHNGSNVEIFVYNSLVTYKCDHNFSLIGEASIHCTTKDNINGVWNGSAPECKDPCGPARRRRRDTNGKEMPDMCQTGGKSPDPGFDTHIGIPGIGSDIATVAGITAAAIVIAIAIVAGIFAALNKKWKKKKGSYGVNLDSPKYHIAPEDDLQMSETKSNLIIKV